MSPRRDDGRENRRTESDDELATLLSDLESTLGDLRRELDARDGRESGEPTDRERERYGYRPPERGDERDRSDDGRRRGRRGESPLPRPPSVGELLRFTEEYTIPTVVATLEATIRSLELLRRVLRLADPGRSAFGDDARDGERAGMDRLARSRVGRDALSGLDSALSEMRTALSEADLPEDEASRSVLEEARGLVDEIEARVDEAERARGETRDADRRSREGRSDDARRDRTGGRRESVRIDVTDESATGEREESDDSPADDEDESQVDDRPKVDVEAELESIRREMRGDADPSADPESGASPGESDEDGASDADDADDADDGR